MTTEVRTFTAESMQAALDIVRREMGPDAVILHTRQIAKRRLLPWMKSRQEVEITAGMGVTVRSSSSSASSSAITAPPKHRSLKDDDLSPPPALLKPVVKPQPEIKPATSPVNRITTPTAPKTDSPIPLRLQTRTPVPVRADSLTPRTTSRPASLPSTANDSTAEIHKRLDALQQALAELSRQSKVRVTEEIPAELVPLFTKLIDADVDDVLAREYISRIKQQATSDQLANPQAALALLTTLLEREIRCARPITAVRGRRKVVALIGPTGVGKTTTIAKLAANYRLRDRLKLGLVTVDTYRVAAVEQLRTYAEIIDLPMKVVTNPDEMRSALEELAHVDLVLIDTAGRSPNDEIKLQELKTLLTDTGVDEVHLVLSLAVGAKALELTAEKFSSLKLASVMLTKLDEAPSTGALLTVARRVACPISYLTTGQNVPEDIEAANSARLAQWVLGQQRIP